MPEEPLGPPQVPCDTCLEAPPGAARVDIQARLELDVAEPPGAETHRAGDPDQELVTPRRPGTTLLHRVNLRASIRYQGMRIVRN